MNPKVLSMAPQSHINWMFRPPVWAQLNEEFEVWQNPEARHLAPEETLDQAADCVAVITGWGAKAFGAAWLDAAPALKIVAHTAGSPRPLFGDETVREILIPRGIAVYSGADGMALNVAEQTIGLMILGARRFPLQARKFKEKQRHGASSIPTPAPDARFLSGSTVGLVSASKVARQVIPLLHAFGCTILLYDPFLTARGARELGARLVDLPEMFEACDIVSLHAPDLPATRGLIGADLLARLRPGATFINTSRGSVVDHDALLQECQSGRIFAALDVTQPEPLPPDSPFWDDPNALLLPHMAGQGRAGYAKIGEGALQAIRDALAHRPIQGAVPLQHWEIVA